MQQLKSLYVSQLLTNTSLKYTNEKYIAEEVFPIITVKKDSAKIVTYGMDNLRIVDALRSIGSKTNVVGHTVSIGDHYRVVERALKEAVSWGEMEQADRPIQPKIDATENVTEIMKVIKEKTLADSLTSSSVITQYVTLTGTDQWDDYANSDPLGDVKTGQETIRAATGKVPNTLIFSWDVYNAIKYHPDIIGLLSNAADNTPDRVRQKIADAFDVKRVIVGEAQYNSGKEGSTDSLTDIWTKDVVLAYIEPNPTLKSRSLGFTYQKKSPRVVDTWSEIDEKVDYVRVTDEFDQKLVDAKCAYLIEAAI